MGSRAWRGHRCDDGLNVVMFPKAVPGALASSARLCLTRWWTLTLGTNVFRLEYKQFNGARVTLKVITQFWFDADLPRMRNLHSLHPAGPMCDCHHSSLASRD